MSRGRATKEDPRGIIAESYVIEDLTVENARAIFLDWAMMDAPSDAGACLAQLLARFEGEYPGHPMTQILREGALGASKPKARRGGRKARS